MTPQEPRQNARAKPGPKGKRFATCQHCGREAGRKNTKYCSNTCQAAHQWQLTKQQIDRDGAISRGVAPVRSARRYLKERDGEHCALCGGTEWQGRPMPLVLDHIDGNAANWRVENLRLICPNCDAQLPTFKSRNRRKGRAWRRARYAAGQSY